MHLPRIPLAGLAVLSLLSASTASARADSNLYQMRFLAAPHGTACDRYSSDRSVVEVYGSWAEGSLRASLYRAEDHAHFYTSTWVDPITEWNYGLDRWADLTLDWLLRLGSVVTRDELKAMHLCAEDEYRRQAGLDVGTVDDPWTTCDRFPSERAYVATTYDWFGKGSLLVALFGNEVGEEYLMAHMLLLGLGDDSATFEYIEGSGIGRIERAGGYSITSEEADVLVLCAKDAHAARVARQAAGHA